MYTISSSRRRVLTALVLGVGIGAAAMFVFDFGYSWAAYISILLGVVASVLLFRYGRGRPLRARSPWVLFGVGTSLWVVADLAWIVWPWFTGTEPPYPGLPDVIYLAAYPAFAIGVLLLPTPRSVGYRRIGSFLDTLIGTSAVAIVSWSLILRPLWNASAGGSTLTMLVDTAYPLGDLVLVLALMAALVREVAGSSRVVALLGLGMLLMLAGDVLWLAGGWLERDTYYQWAEAPWVLGYAALAIAALQRPSEGVPIEGARATRVGRVVQLIPYIAAGGLVVFTILAVGGKLDVRPPSIIAAMLVVAAVMLRQWVSLQGNRDTLAAERNELVLVISHELRTPLTGAVGFLEVLLGQWDEIDVDEKRDLATVALEQTQQVGRIVADLITVARDRQHLVDHSPIPFPIQSVIRDAVAAVFGPEPAGLSVSCSEGVVVEGDRSRLVQVVTNLLTNATKYGRGRVSVECHASAPRGVYIDVHDNGPGIPTKFVSTIWEPFERGAHRLDSSIPGSGLGLPIVRSIVQGHGGTVSYDRSPQLGGAWFRIYLPTSRDSMPSGSATSQRVRQSSR